MAQHHQLGRHRGLAPRQLRQPTEHPNRGQVQQPNNHAADHADKAQTPAHTHETVLAQYKPLTLGNVDKNFRRFLWQARIPHGGRGHGPRVHDLRHAFAVNNLRDWFIHGEDVGALLPVLQTYMGHSSIADTAYYLRLTAESYPHIGAQVQRVIGDVVPPITAGPHHGH